MITKMSPFCSHFIEASIDFHLKLEVKYFYYNLIVLEYFNTNLMYIDPRRVSYEYYCTLTKV